MKTLIPLMLCISLFTSLTAVAFVGDKGSTKATTSQSKNVKRTHSPITDKVKRTHSPITDKDTKTKATKN
jgi:hypothetical protein